MQEKIQKFLQPYLRKDLPEIRPGQEIRVSQKIKEGDKERVTVFSGQVIARKHGQEAGASLTIRRMAAGQPMEMILPLHSPAIEKIEILKQARTRRAKLYYLRSAKGKRAKLREA